MSFYHRQAYLEEWVKLSTLSYDTTGISLTMSLGVRIISCKVLLLSLSFWSNSSPLLVYSNLSIGQSFSTLLFYLLWPYLTTKIVSKSCHFPHKNTLVGKHWLRVILPLITNKSLNYSLFLSIISLYPFPPPSKAIL